MTRFYLMESGFLQRLLSDRKELLAIARTFKTAEEMRAARADLMASTRAFITPKAGTDPSTLYSVDREGVAHIPIVGELTPAAQTDICGAYTASALTEYGFIEAAARAADADPGVTAIAFEADSPGGYLDGLDQTAQVIAALSKPTRTNVRNQLASAAVWLASQTDEIVASSPADLIGSIGVAAEEWDDTQALADAGIQRRVFTSTDAPDKRIDTSTDEGKAKIVALLDATHAVFVQRVAEGRGVTPEKVNSDFGHGGMMTAGAAMAAGLIDGVNGQSMKRKPAGVAGEQTAAKADGISQTGGVKNMDLTELKKDHPALYAEATAEARAAGKVEGITEGVTQERKRLEQLNAFRGINADGDKAVDAAIREGKAYADAAPLLSAAVTKGAGKGADGDNPPDVATAAQTAAGGAAVSEEAVRMGAKMGVTAADIKKFGGAPQKEER
jgi:ClpP class serine protease